MAETARVAASKVGGECGGRGRRRREWLRWWRRREWRWWRRDGEGVGGGGEGGDGDGGGEVGVADGGGGEGGGGGEVGGACVVLDLARTCDARESNARSR